MSTTAHGSADGQGAGARQGETDWETHQRIKGAILASLGHVDEDGAMTTTDGQGASEAGRERYQTDTRQPHSYVGFVTQEEHIDKLRHLEARVRREVAAEYVPLMAAHDSAITEIAALRAAVAAQRPVVEAVAELRAALIEWDESQEPRDFAREALARVRRRAAYKALWRAADPLARATPDAGQGA